MPLPPGTRPTVGSGQDFEPLPENIYVVRIDDLEQKEQPSFNNPEVTEVVWLFKFSVVSPKEYADRFLWKRARPVIASGDKPSILYQIVSRAYKNAQMSEDEAQALDPNELIGRQLQVIVKQKTGKDGKIKNNVTEFLALAGDPVPVDTGAPVPEVNIDDIPL